MVKRSCLGCCSRVKASDCMWQKQSTKWRLFSGMLLSSTTTIIISFWLHRGVMEKEDYELSRDFTWPFWTGTEITHHDHVVNSSLALAQLGARASVACCPLTDIGLRARERVRKRIYIADFLKWNKYRTSQHENNTGYFVKSVLFPSQLFSLMFRQYCTAKWQKIFSCEMPSPIHPLRRNVNSEFLQGWQGSLFLMPMLPSHPCSHPLFIVHKHANAQNYTLTNF